MHMQKEYKLFISHAERDSKIVDLFVDLLCHLGLSEQNIIYSSRPEFGVPLGEDIYDFLRSELQSEKIIPIFMLSANYYQSAACLNEMGAIWMKQSDYYTILLPDFRFEEIKGAINPRKMSVHLGRDPFEVQGELNKFKDEICRLFDLKINETLWERKRNSFLKYILEIDDSIRVNMNESVGFCIGSFDLDAAIVKYDPVLKEAIGKFDFGKTSADLCSMVFYLDSLNLRRKVLNRKSLKFSLKSDGIEKIVVEIQIGNSNAKQSVHVNITAASEWQEYEILLTEFGGAISKWEYCRELNFLLYRTNAEKELNIIRVKDILFV